MSRDTCFRSPENQTLVLTVNNTKHFIARNLHQPRCRLRRTLLDKKLKEAADKSARHSFSRTVCL